MADTSEGRNVNAAIDRLNAENLVPKPFTIRQASRADADQISAIGKSAGDTFATISALADLAEHEIKTEQVYKWLDAGAVCLLLDGEKGVGFVAAHVMDDALYIDEISVRSDYQGKGVGGYLIKALFEWARERQRKGEGKARVSLLTYAEVPWNLPWYARRGFREVDAAIVGPSLAEELQHEMDKGVLPRPGYRRCAMLWEDRHG